MSEVPDDRRSIIELFAASVERHPEKHAIRFQGDAHSFGDLARQVASLSARLKQAGLKSGDHLGVLLPNGVEFVALMLAAADLGLVLVPHNTTLEPPVLRRAFEVAEVDHIVAWHSLIASLRPELESRPSPNRVWISVGGSAPDCLSFDELTRGDEELRPDPRQSGGDLPYILTMTSGSTGAPKPIVLSQATKVRRAAAAMSLYGVTAKDVTMAATPLYHSLAERLVLMPLLSGGTSVLLPGFTARQWIDRVVQDRVSFTIAVSSQLKQVLSELAASDRQLPSLRCLVSSSERLDVGLKKELLAHLECDFHECYGASEIAIATNLAAGTASDKVTSVGCPPGDVEIRILDEHRREIRDGSPGEIACRTPMLFSGYFGRPDETRSALEDGYFCTGDMGRLDGAGYLYFLGRKKDIIITGGINVYPKDIEDVLLAHESVVEAAVVALPDPRLGEMVTAVVVVAGGAALPERELERLCARELADFQQPRCYVSVPALPRNAMGKIAKRELVEQLNAGRKAEA